MSLRCHRIVTRHTKKINTSTVGSYLCLCSSCPPCPCMTTCPEACFPSLGESIWGMSTSSKPRSKRLCLELSGRKKKAPKHKVMKALRMRRRMNFSESLNVALWCGKEEAPGDRVGILRPDSGRRAGVVMFWLLKWTSLGEEIGGQGGVGLQVPHVLLQQHAQAGWLYYLIPAWRSPETKKGWGPSAKEWLGIRKMVMIILKKKGRSRGKS